MRILVLSAVLLAVLLSAGCAASSTPPSTPIAPLASGTPPAAAVTPTAPVAALTPSPAAATPPVPPGTGNSTPRAGLTLAPRRPTGTAPAGGALNVTFERSGGFTGRNDTFRLKSDGSVDDGKVVLHAANGASDAATLASQLEATGIYSVAPGRYMGATTCCDRYEYDLTLTQNGQSLTFVTIDNADSAPPPLLQAIRLISQYIDAAN